VEGQLLVEQAVVEEVASWRRWMQWRSCEDERRFLRQGLRRRVEVVERLLVGKSARLFALQRVVQRLLRAEDELVDELEQLVVKAYRRRSSSGACHS
jgi:hypothetical protein